MSLVLSYAIGDGSTMPQQGLGKSISTESLQWTGTSLAMWSVDQYPTHQNSLILYTFERGDPPVFFVITAELSFKLQAVVDVQWRPTGRVSKWKQINAWVVGESLSYMISRYSMSSALCKENPFQTLAHWLLFVRSTHTFIAFYCSAVRFRPRAFSTILGGTGDPFFCFELTRTIETLKSMSVSTNWVFPKIGGKPQNGWWKYWKTRLKWIIWGVFPLFLETPD